MDGVFDNLLHTDRSAEKIIKDADRKRIEMVQAADSQNKAYDQTDQEETDKLIRAQHEKMDTDRKNELDGLRASVQASIVHIQSEYEQHGRDWAEAITKRILEV